MSARSIFSRWFVFVLVAVVLMTPLATLASSDLGVPPPPARAQEDKSGGAADDEAATAGAADSGEQSEPESAVSLETQDDQAGDAAGGSEAEESGGDAIWTEDTGQGGDSGWIEEPVQTDETGWYEDPGQGDDSGWNEADEQAQEPAPDESAGSIDTPVETDTESSEPIETEVTPESEATATETPAETATATEIPVKPAADSLVPQSPTITNPTCESGTFVFPTVTLPTGPEGISYELVTQPTLANNWLVEVQATVTDQYAEITDASGWFRNSTKQSTYSKYLPPTYCQLTPQNPTITSPTCESGTFVFPTVTLPTGPEGISYELVTQPTLANNWLVEVQATVTDQYAEITDAPGWFRNSTKQSTYSKYLPPTYCQLTPQAPTITNPTCVNGTLQPSVVTFADGPAGMSYAVTTEPTAANNWLVEVQATVTDQYAEITDASGWFRNSTKQSTYSKYLTPQPCVGLSPVAPEIQGNTCVSGTYVMPTVVPATIPAGITYTVLQQPTAANDWTYRVEAKVETAGETLDALSEGWEKQNDTTAIFTATVSPNFCTVIPPNPIEQAGYCGDGPQFHAPSVSLPTIPNGMDYEIVELPHPGNGWTYEVRVTITQSNTILGELESKWTRDSNTQATLRQQLAVEYCTITPLDPMVSGGICVDGVFQPPVVSFGALPPQIYYEILQQPNAANGWTYRVKATNTLHAPPIYTMGTLGAGWTPIDETQAVFDGTVKPVFCTLVPENPSVSDGFCENGVVVPPTITPATGPDGVSYQVLQEATAENGWTYRVAATIGLSDTVWGALPPGWTEENATYAIYSGKAAPQACQTVVLAKPMVKAGTNVCVDGTLIPPAIEPPATAGVAFSVLQAPTASNGWNYLVGAKIVEPGVPWGDLSGSGWIPIDAVQATYAGTVKPNTCAVAKPDAPQKPAAPHTPSGVSGLPATGAGVAAGLTTAWSPLLAGLALAAASGGWLMRRKPR